MPLLALAVKSASLTRIARTLVETYLGRDPGRRVLAGGIARGVADRIEAVLWFSDLRGYTRITDTSPPEQVIPLLNDYADAVISAIHANGGDVLKLIGDGTLAIFTAADREAACRAALKAAKAVRHSIGELNRRRAGDQLPVTDIYLALHFGAVFYGNIGSKERLDFTVVGPAVNEVSRIAALCRSVEQPLLLSASFAAAAGSARSQFVSVGRYALRGVSTPQELFTLDPTAGCVGGSKARMPGCAARRWERIPSLFRHCERSEAIQRGAKVLLFSMDHRVEPGMTGAGVTAVTRAGHRAASGILQARPISQLVRIFSIVIAGRDPAIHRAARESVAEKALAMAQTIALRHHFVPQSHSAYTMKISSGIVAPRVVIRLPSR